MKTLYIVSTESFSGKTSLCYGIAARMKRDGRRVGYFKPLVFFGRLVEGRTLSEDAPFMRVSLALKETDDLLAPNILDMLSIENAAAGRSAHLMGGKRQKIGIKFLHIHLQVRYRLCRID